MPEAIERLARLRRLVLGSGSARRVALLKETGVPFRQIVPEVDETILPDEDPFDAATRLAGKKALAVANDIAADELVLGGDTVVVLDGKPLGKPTDEQHAFEMLTLLSGKRHRVGTGLAFSDHNDRVDAGVEVTEVHFNDVTAEQIRDYIATGEPMDKAGAYGIQGMGAFLVDTIEGNLDTVIGLPLTLLNHLAGDILRRIEHDIDCK